MQEVNDTGLYLPFDLGLGIKMALFHASGNLPSLKLALKKA